MRPIDIENFIKNNNLDKFNTFAIVKDKNCGYWQYYWNIVKIDSQINGFYENNIIKEHIKIPIDLWDLFHVFNCIIFDCGDLIMCLDETWDGWQPSMMLDDYYNVKNNIEDIM